MPDKDLLDWLDTQGTNVAFRWSTTGRGWRLHQMGAEEAEAFGVKVYPTAREAIKAALENDKAKGG